MKAFLIDSLKFIGSFLVGYFIFGLLLTSIIFTIWIITWYTTLLNSNDPDPISTRKTTILIVLGLFLGSLTSLIFEIYVRIMFAEMYFH